MAILDSRYIGMIDIPEPQDLRSRFVYNFFVPDERTNRSGAARFQGVKKESTQRLIDTRVAQAHLPRYIEINFDEARSGDGNIEDLGNQPILTDPAVKGKTDNEDTLTTERDAIYRYTDRSVRARLTGKARLLSKLMTLENEDVLDQILEISKENEKIDVAQLQEVLSPESTPGVEYVNDVGKLNEPDVYVLASSLTLDMFLDRRLLRASLGGDYTKESLLKTVNTKKAKDDALKFLPTCSTDGQNDSFEPTFTLIKTEPVQWPSEKVNTMTIGYILERIEVNEAGELVGTSRFLIDGASSTSFIDTKIAYGSTYTYSVRTVSLIQRVIDSDGNDDLPPGFYNSWSLVSSRPSKMSIVEAIERVPPLEPDGVFYRYNYDGGGLVLRWQIPVGKQRDVKYFQIFRRKSIYDPFTCVAQIDFDDSTMVSTKREQVDPSNNFKFDSPTTSFIDSDFNRESSYIYAIAAIDAHGLTSGYSAQSLVSFDRIKNVINLKNISKPGAPKQYPNFFIDPDLDDNIFVDSLTQDAIFVSKKNKIKVYFDPDAATFSSVDGRTGEIISTKNNNAAVYKLHLINIDRQKSTTLEIAVDNLGSS